MLRVDPRLSMAGRVASSDGSTIGARLVIGTAHGVTSVEFFPSGIIFEGIVGCRYRVELVSADPLAEELLWTRAGSRPVPVPHCQNFVEIG